MIAAAVALDRMLALFTRTVGPAALTNPLIGATILGVRSLSLGLAGAGTLLLGMAYYQDNRLYGGTVLMEWIRRRTGQEIP